jgi:hypothetical protein
MVCIHANDTSHPIILSGPGRRDLLIGSTLFLRTKESPVPDGGWWRDEERSFEEGRHGAFSRNLIEVTGLSSVMGYRVVIGQPQV